MKLADMASKINELAVGAAPHEDPDCWNQESSEDEEELEELEGMGEPETEEAAEFNMMPRRRAELCIDEECLKDCFMAAPPKAQPQFQPQAKMMCKKSSPSPVAAAGKAVLGGISRAAAAATSFFGAPSSAAQFEGARMQAGLVLADCCCEQSAWQGDIGFKTGGAQDVCNLHENVKAGYLPLPSDVTFEGVVKSYYFDCSPEGGAVAGEERCTDLFFPTYSLALAPDPLLAAAPSTGASPDAGAPAQPPEIFLSVGLDSGLTSFQRPRLNLLLLLDVSGSMDATFDSYYYTPSGERKDLPAEEWRKTKLDVAKEVVVGMMDKLSPDDSVSVILFSDDAINRKPFGPMRTARLGSLRAGVQRLKTIGGTNLQAGMDAAAAEFRRYAGYRSADPMTTESRMVILTDAEPNEGDFTGEGLMARVKANALDGIHTTFIGVGLDFNTQLIQSIGKVKGCNYYSVHSPGEFRQRLCEEFDAMVSPLVFDLALKIDDVSMAGGWRIAAAYGTPNPEETALSEDGTLMKIHTLFPSPKTEEGIKGGVALLRMAPPAPAATEGGATVPLALSATYRDRSGRAFASTKEVKLPEGLLGAAGNLSAAEGAGTNAAGGAGSQVAPLFQSSGVRKAVALARYVDALQSWLVDQRAPNGHSPSAPPEYLRRFGIDATTATRQQCWLRAGQRLLPPPPALLVVDQSGGWERAPAKLAVNPGAREALGMLLGFMRGEVEGVGDPEMKQEVELLELLVACTAEE